MMSRRLLVLALLILPITAQAQRRGGGGGGGRGGSKRADYSKMGGGGGAITISDKDVEGLNPVKVLLEKKKDLSLTDEQVNQLKALDAKLKTENDTLYKQVDSLRKEMKPNSNAPNPQVDQLRVRGARTAIVEVINAIHASYDAKEADALAVLTDGAQKTSGNEILDKHQAEAEDMLKKKLGGGKSG